MFLPALPNWFAGGATKQAVSKYLSIVPPSRRPSQARFGRAFVNVAATFGQDVGMDNERGRPERAWTIPESCQSPKSAAETPLVAHRFPRPKGISQTTPEEKTWV